MLLSQTSDENALSSLPHQCFLSNRARKKRDCSQLDKESRATFLEWLWLNIFISLWMWPYWLWRKRRKNHVAAKKTGLVVCRGVFWANPSSKFFHLSHFTSNLFRIIFDRESNVLGNSASFYFLFCTLAKKIRIRKNVIENTLKKVDLCKFLRVLCLSSAS